MALVFNRREHESITVVHEASGDVFTITTYDITGGMGKVPPQLSVAVIDPDHKFGFTREEIEPGNTLTRFQLSRFNRLKANKPEGEPWFDEPPTPEAIESAKAFTILGRAGGINPSRIDFARESGVELIYRSDYGRVRVIYANSRDLVISADRFDHEIDTIPENVLEIRETTVRWIREFLGLPEPMPDDAATVEAKANTRRFAEGLIEYEDDYSLGRGMISQVGGRPGDTVKGSVDDSRFRK